MKTRAKILQFILRRDGDMRQMADLHELPNPLREFMTLIEDPPSHNGWAAVPVEYQAHTVHHGRGCAHRLEPCIVTWVEADTPVRFVEAMRLKHPVAACCSR